MNCLRKLLFLKECFGDWQSKKKAVVRTGKIRVDRAEREGCFLSKGQEDGT